MLQMQYKWRTHFRVDLRLCYITAESLEIEIFIR